jgi:hypothetical protein
MNTQSSTHVYQVRPRKDKRGVDLISDALPFGRLHNCRVEIWFDLVGRSTVISIAFDMSRVGQSTSEKEGNDETN